jgi:hypothetical protein
MLGRAAVAIWFDTPAEIKAELEDWHTHEHMPERLRIPGFLRGTRWIARSGEPSYFVLYETARLSVTSSAPYLERLNEPTPWSRRMMPHHRNMVRSQCHVAASRGGVVARHALTVRLCPVAGRAGELQSFLDSMASALAGRPGLVGAHVLRHEAPAIGTTKEQEIRDNADRSADQVFVACGYDASTLQLLSAADLSAERLSEHGAGPGTVAGLYTLSCSLARGDTP